MGNCKIDQTTQGYFQDIKIMEKRYCPYCKSEQEVYPRGTLAVQLVDGSRIVEYQCTKCGRPIRERKGGKK